MAVKTEAQKKAQKKYMENFCEVKVRMTPERREAIKLYADSTGESVTAFINRAITEAMERDGGQRAVYDKQTERRRGQWQKNGETEKGGT